MIKLEREIRPNFRITDLDRRKSLRFLYALPFEYREMDNPKIRLGYTTNISEGGLMVSLTEKMAVGEKLRIKIFFISGRDLRTLDAIEVTGKIVWIDPDKEKLGNYRIGMEFEDISSKNLENLRHFLEHFGDRY